MNALQHKSSLLFASSLIALAACSDSGAPSTPVTGAPPAPTPPPTASAPIQSDGVITGFGSIYVNGVRYVTDANTVIAVEDEGEFPGAAERLRLGMRVRIAASQSNGERRADRIDVDEDLKGPARNIAPDADNPAIGRFTVARQAVIVDDNTVFDDDIGDNDANPGIDIRDLDPVNFPGNAPLVVEVSGFVTDGGVVATRIDRVNAAAGDIGRPGVDGDEVEVKGFVDSVADDGGSFAINDTTFIVNNATAFEDGLMPDASLVGIFVEVKADIDAMDQFIAVSVEREDDIDDDDRDGEFEIEGILQSVDTTGDPDIIVVNGVEIPVEDASSLEGKVGEKVEIKGEFNDAGVLVIAGVEIERENTIRLIDRVASVDAPAGAFTTRLGLDVAPTEMSRIRDDVGEDGDRLTPDQFLTRLMTDDYVEARGYVGDDGAVVWTRVRRRERDDLDCRLKGPVDDAPISDPTFSILGVTIDTTGLEFDDFETDDGLEIGRNEFFALLEPGLVVQAKTRDDGAGCTDGRLAASGGVEFDDDDDVFGNEKGEENGENESAPEGGVIELVGDIREIDAAANTFVITGRTITVGPDTLIDASIVERARGVDLPDDDLRYGDLPETLDDLFSDGDRIEVRANGEGLALKIEDA